MEEISPINFFKYYQTNLNFKIIDIRTTNEYEKYHIIDALNIPCNLLIQKHHLFLNNHTKYFIICKNGNLSYHTTKYLSRLGYKVINVIGGMDNWRGEAISNIA